MRFGESKMALVRTMLCSLSSPFLGLGLATASVWLTAVMVMGAVILDTMLER
jgi:hypothetical protein